jgi:hypothetical protein
VRSGADQAIEPEEPQIPLNATSRAILIRLTVNLATQALTYSAQVARVRSGVAREKRAQLVLVQASNPGRPFHDLASKTAHYLCNAQCDGPPNSSHV